MECNRQVDLLEDDSCVNGHARSAIRGIRNEKAPRYVERTPDLAPEPEELFMAPVRRERSNRSMLTVCIVGGVAVFAGFAWIASTLSSVMTFTDATQVKADAASSGAASTQVLQPVPTSPTQSPSAQGGVQGIGIMMPTIGATDLLGYRYYTLEDPPERGQIVSLLPGARIVGGIRRIVALGGDEVAIKAGYVWLNNQPVTEKYVTLVDPSFDSPAVKVPEGSYYVIGDNRTLLSRYPNTFGVVEARYIDSRVATIKKLE
jgi:signal peptidase I